MLRLTDPRRLARRRLVALARHIPEARDGQAEGVHQARVASRRLRELLPIYGVSPDLQATAKRLRARVRRLTRGLGRVRELDVAGFTLDDLCTRGAADTAAAQIVRGDIARDRVEAASAMLAAIRSLDVDRLAHRVTALATGLIEPAARRRMAVALAGRIGERGHALRTTIEIAGTVYAPDRLHRIRIALKKYRYSLELAQELGRFRLRGTIERLKHLQDLLGSLHDHEVLAARVRDCGADAVDETRQAALAALARHLDVEVRRLHGEFLAATDSLVVVFFWARRVRLRLDAPPVRMKRGHTSKTVQRAPGVSLAAAG